MIGVARMYPQPFDEPEVALIESVAVSTGQTLERLWAHEERDVLIGQLKESFVGTAEALANALEAKDNYTADHASEVADLAVASAASSVSSSDDLENLRYGAIFHDIGKIAIPDAILHKPGPLDDEERAVMMRHPEIGAQIVAPIPFLSPTSSRWSAMTTSASTAAAIPTVSPGRRSRSGRRIILVVDTFHAMISDRPYRKAMPKPEAMAEIARNSGTQFDPAVVGAFVRVVGYLTPLIEILPEGVERPEAGQFAEELASFWADTGASPRGRAERLPHVICVCRDDAGAIAATSSATRSGPSARGTALLGLPVPRSVRRGPRPVEPMLPRRAASSRGVHRRRGSDRPLLPIGDPELIAERDEAFWPEAKLISPAGRGRRAAPGLLLRRCGGALVAL